MTDEPFTLQNDPPKPKRLAIEDDPRRQRVLLDGLNDCRGQQDLPFSESDSPRDCQADAA